MYKYIKPTAILMLLLVVFYYINKIQGCSVPNDNGIIVTPLKTVTPTKDELKLVPKGHSVDGVIKPKLNKNSGDKSKKIDTSIIIHRDNSCMTCTAEVLQVDNVTTYLGFTNYPKFYIGYVDSSLNFGYAHEFFRYGKLGLNANISIPYLGLTVSHDITNNFFGYLGGNIKYIQYNNIENLSSYKLSLLELTNIYPAIGVGFNF